MNATFIEQIEAYLEGAITKAELEAQAKAAGISNLDQEIQWFQDSQTAVEAAGLRDQLKEVLPQAPTQTAKVRQLRPMRTIMAIAASVLVLVVAYVAFFQTNDTDLYAQYEFVDPGLPVLMSQSDQYELYDALTYFGEADYQVAAEKLRGLQAQMDNDTLHYYLGASELYLGNTEAAQQSLEPVLKNETSSFYPQAQWLSVLTALKAKNYDLAKTRLEPVLGDEDHPFQAQAKALAQELEND